MEGLSFVCIEEGTGKAVRRDTVELCGGLLPEIKLKSSHTVPVGTKVQIRNGRQTANGVVDKCRTDHSKYVVTVHIQRGGQWLLDLVPLSNYDPGVHSVNKFISEDRFLQLMGEMDSLNHSGGN
jgi:hypothetical protein